MARFDRAGGLSPSGLSKRSHGVYTTVGHKQSKGVGQ